MKTSRSTAPAPYHADGSAGHVAARDGADEEGIAIAATVALRMSWREKQLGGGHASWRLIKCIGQTRG